MALLARLLMLVPALIAGWLVSRNDPRFWVLALAVALLMLTLTSLIVLYWSSVGREPERPAGEDRNK